jgi:hypothetical protein
VPDPHEVEPRHSKGRGSLLQSIAIAAVTVCVSVTLAYLVASHNESGSTRSGADTSGANEQPGDVAFSVSDDIAELRARQARLERRQNETFAHTSEMTEETESIADDEQPRARGESSFVRRQQMLDGFIAVEPRDEAWADHTESEMRGAVDAIAVEFPGTRFLGGRCATTLCRYEFEFPTEDERFDAMNRLIRHARVGDVSDGTNVVLDPPHPEPGEPARAILHLVREGEEMPLLPH